MKSIVVAYDLQRGIGQDNDLPWGRNLPADLQRFKKITTGKSIIMGRKTFESIGSRPLPNRQNIVISHTPTGVEGVMTALSLPAAYAIARYDIMIIGGESIFKESLPDIDRIYATEVQAIFPEASVHFPALVSEDWKEVARQAHSVDDQNRYDYTFLEYQRKTATSI